MAKPTKKSLEKQNRSRKRKVILLCFFALAILHLLDLTTTWYALEYVPNAMETNKFAEHMFNFGYLGWLGVHLYYLSMIILVLAFAEGIIMLNNKAVGYEIPFSQQVAFYLLYTSFVFVSWSMAVLNNISIIIRN